MPALPRFDVQGQVALVTGAACGLSDRAGAGSGRRGRCARLRDAAADGGVPGEIKALGRRAAAADSHGPARTDRPGGAGGRARFGRLDILVNNAGIAPRNPAEDVREEDLDAILAVNLKATFPASQAAGRVMIS